MTNLREDPALAATVVGGDALRPGTRVGEYEIEREIGRGATGVVYAARHPVIDKRVAVKVLDLLFSHDATLVRRFTDEARSVNKIGHPNIIDVFSFGQLPDGRQYFVMEYLEGETMASWLARGCPEPVEACRLLLQVCEALEAAHREGIIHRDLKPENLWIARPKHSQSFIKVLDFGIAKLVAQEERPTTKTGVLIGTPSFMSPEQCMGHGVDHRTDIYALGAIMYCVYCGRAPFEGGSLAEIISAQLYVVPPRPLTIAAMPPALDALIMACLDKEPANRPASAAELGVRLKSAASFAGGVTTGYAPLHRTGDAAAPTCKGYAPGKVDEPAEPDTARHRSRWPLIVVLSLLIGGAAIWMSMGRRHQASPYAATPLPDHATAVPSLESQPAPTPSSVPVVSGTTTAISQPTGQPSEMQARPREGRPASLHSAWFRRSRAGAVNQEPTAAPAQPVPSTEAGHKPSRAKREGLEEENPF